jgi:3-oxoacyl-[acyl-carrier protein] reductase
MGLLEGQVALVTAGAGAGIGQATVRRFLEEGATVVLTDAHARRAQEVARALSEEFGREVVGRHLDVTDELEVQAVVDETLSAHGRIDVLFNNAGINKLEPVWEMSTGTWRHVLDVCLTGTFYTIRAVLPSMIARRSGRIVNMASVAGWVGSSGGECHYAAAKAGVMGLTRAVASEVARHGIRVNAIAPSLIYNEFLERIYPREFFERARARAPLGRVGEPLDVANVAVFLASDQSAYITGEVLCVAGGTVFHA